MTNLAIAGKFNPKQCINLYLYQTQIYLQFLVVVREIRQFPLSLISILKNNWKFTCCFKNHRKIVAIASISILLNLMEDKK